MSRYDASKAKFFFYIFRFWCIPSIFLFYIDVLNFDGYAWHYIFLYFLNYFLVYFLVYDYFSLQNDVVSLSETSGATRRSVATIDYQYIKYYWLLSFFLVLFLPINLSSFIFGLCIYYSLIFSLHNLLRPRLRPISYFFLYFGKHLFLLLPFVLDYFYFLIFVAIYAFTYLPNYILKKFEIKPNRILLFFSKGYVLKTTAFAILGICLDKIFLIFSVLNIVVTAAEYVFLRMKGQFEKVD